MSTGAAVFVQLPCERQPLLLQAFWFSGLRNGFREILPRRCLLSDSLLRRTQLR
jgi:hypothetical protein